jgi:hypothetical protein
MLLGKYSEVEDEDSGDKGRSSKLLKDDEAKDDQEENKQAADESSDVIKKEIDNSVAARGKRFLKAISAGGVENGIYFKKNKQYFSLVTGCISLVGAVVILTAAFKIYYDIFTEKVINATVEYPKNNVGFYNVKFMTFYHQTHLYF